MEKKYRFLASMLWLFFIVRIAAREDKNHIVFENQFTCMPNTQVFTQIDLFENKNSFDVFIPQNLGFSSSRPNQDWYQQHLQYVLNRVVGMPLQGKIIKITPEDIALIDRICKDNPHKAAILIMVVINLIVLIRN